MRKFFAVLLALLALGTAGGALYLTSWAEEVRPYVADGPGGPTETLQRFFDCLDRQDWSGADSLLDGGSLGLETPPEDALSARFWTAQRDARSYTVAEGYEMEGTSLVKQAAVTVPDFSTAPAFLHARVQEQLGKAVESARLKSEVYDETGAYRKELVMDALSTAVEELLSDVSPYLTRRELTVRMRYDGSGWKLRPDAALVSALTAGAVRTAEAAGAAPAFEMYVNNLTASALEGLLPVPKVYWLSEDTVVAPRPDPAGYGSSTDPSAVSAVIADAANRGLLAGQSTLWTPETPIADNTPVRWYLDDTILAVTWKQPIDQCCYTFSEVKVAHPSQFRRYFADDTFAAPRQYLPSEMARTVNAVSALSGDFYKFRNLGIVVYRRQLYRNLGQYIDTCFIDSAGNLRMVRAGELTQEADVLRYIADNDILFSLTFGPVLIEHGELVVPDYYPIGEIRDTYARSVICQLGDCHYLTVTVSNEGSLPRVSTARQTAEALYAMGVQEAFMLDGGQTAASILGGELINRVVYGHERNISDIIYFATAIPEADSAAEGG